jgi:hypothetical protein
MSYIYTYSRKKIDLLNPKPMDIDINSISNGLSRICRFNGQIPVHYSVASHSLLMLQAAKTNGESNEVLKAILMHDASEAYLGDIVKPLKEVLPRYKEIEENMSNVIYRKYKVKWQKFKDIVHKYDLGMLVLEKKIIREIDYTVYDEYIDIKNLISFEEIEKHMLETPSSLSIFNNKLRFTYEAHKLGIYDNPIKF